MMTRIADGKWTEARSAESVEAHRLRSRAKGRALQKLKELHQEEFERLYAQQLELVRPMTASYLTEAP